MDFEPLYKIGDVVYTIYEGCIAPLLITEVRNWRNGFLYGYSYSEFVILMKRAREAGVHETNIPKLEKGSLFLQEDLFVSSEHMEENAAIIIELMNICSKAEEI